MLTSADLQSIKELFRQEIRTELRKELRPIEYQLGVVERTLIRLDTLVHDLIDKLNSHIQDRHLHSF